MRTRMVIMLMFSLMLNSLIVEAQNKKVNYSKTVTFEVSMTCENCKRTIEKNIAYEKGMKDMKVDLPQKRVTLTFDTRKTNENQIIEALGKLGYDAAVLTEKL